MLNQGILVEVGKELLREVVSRLVSLFEGRQKEAAVCELDEIRSELAVVRQACKEVRTEVLGYFYRLPVTSGVLLFHAGDVGRLPMC